VRRRARIMVVDDEAIVRDSLREWLEEAGYEVITASSAEDVLSGLEEYNLDVLITDLELLGLDGIELMKRARAIQPGLETIVITAYGSISSAITAIKEGAYDYIEKPFCPERVEILIDKIVEHRDLREKNIRLRRHLGESFHEGNLVSKSPRMQRILKMIQTVAKAECTVLIEGETGTGKEIVARAIHRNSNRAEGPFVPVDLASIPETLLPSELFGHGKGAFTGATARRIGKFEFADRGTIFLDEVGDIPPNLQHHLLRILQERQFTRLGGMSLSRSM
jgi:two-component system response regulator PilR (NtrC family)